MPTTANRTRTWLLALRSELHRVEKRVNAALDEPLGCSEAAILLLTRRGYSPLEIVDLTGIPRTKVWSYAKEMGLALNTSGNGNRACHACNKRYPINYTYCFRCGKPLTIPPSWRTLRDGHGAIISQPLKVITPLS